MKSFDLPPPFFVGWGDICMARLGGLCVPCFCGGYSGRETPGPIPNPEAKPASADGTALDRVWESKSPPQFFVSG